jgi:hypothetical protein
MAGQFIITAAAAILDFDGVVFGSSLPPMPKRPVITDDVQTKDAVPAFPTRRRSPERSHLGKPAAALHHDEPINNRTHIFTNLASAHTLLCISTRRG